MYILLYFPAHLKAKTFTRGQAHAADDYYWQSPQAVLASAT